MSDLKEYELGILVPARDVSNTLAYSCESLLRAIDAEILACHVPLRLRVSLTQEQAERLADREQVSQLRDICRNEHGVSIIDVTSVHEVVSDGVMLRVGSQR